MGCGSSSSIRDSRGNIVNLYNPVSATGIEENILYLSTLKIVNSGLTASRRDIFVEFSFSEDLTYHYKSHVHWNNSKPTWTVGLGFFIKDYQNPEGSITCQVKDAGIIDTALKTFRFDVREAVASIGEGEIGITKGTEGKLSYEIEWKHLTWKNFYTTDNDKRDIRIDFWTTAIVEGYRLTKTQAIDVSDMVVSKAPKGQVKTIPIEGLPEILVATDDEVSGDRADYQFLLNILNRSGFDDRQTSFQSRGQGNAYIRSLIDFPLPPEGLWKEDITSDESFSRICFQNQGSEFLSKTDDGFTCDVNDLARFPCRNNSLQYGGKAYFDNDGKPLKITVPYAIFEYVVPGVDTDYFPDQGFEWEWAKLYLRTTIFSLGAGVHLVKGHFRWGNWPSICMRKCLDPDHPIRRLISPHTFRSSHVIITSVVTLTPLKGMFHRAVGLEYPALNDSLTSIYLSFDYKPYLQELTERGMDQAPPHLRAVYEDAVDYHMAVSKYVTAYLDLYYNENNIEDDTELAEFWEMYRESLPGIPELNLESLREVMAETIFRTTGWHNHMGNVVAWLSDVAGVNMFLKKGELLNPVESSLVLGVVATLANTTMPALMGDWGHLVKDEAKETWKSFQGSLKFVADNIAERNTSRKYPFNDFDPADCHISICT